MLTMTLVVITLAVIGTLVLFCGAASATAILCLIATLIDRHNGKLNGELFIDIPESD